MATFVHEWTHYFHFLSSSLGNFIAELEQNAFTIKYSLLIWISKEARGDLSLPVVNMLEQRPALRAVPIIEQGINLLKRTVSCQQMLSASWSTLLHEQLDELEEIRHRKPFVLNEDIGSLLFRCRDGKTIRLRLTSLQLLEHAAKANELILSQGVVPRNQFRTELLDYVGIILFLYQEGIIELERESENQVRLTMSGWQGKETGSIAALLTLFLCCQLSLTLYFDFTSLSDEKSAPIAESGPDPIFAKECAAFMHEPPAGCWPSLARL